MIHICFHQNDLVVLTKAMEVDSDMNGEIICICDDYSVGPIKDIFSQEGMEIRRQWWNQVIDGEDTEEKNNQVPNDFKSFKGLCDALTNEKEVVWIWAAQNKQDVCGYYWLVSQLIPFQGRVFILFLNNLPFISDKGHIFYPTRLSEIPAREFRKAKKLARPITKGEFEIDPDEWSKLSYENKGIRILEGAKKLTSHDYEFYDIDLFGTITMDWIRGHKLIHQFLTRTKNNSGEAFMLWRLKKMIGSFEIDMQGDVNKTKDFEVKLKNTDSVNV